jgi:hypothetical protein
MQPSSTLCRAQEAHHRTLAAATALSNIKTVSMAAAAAWAREAIDAERREERMVRRHEAADATARLRLEQPIPQDRGFSENPDRGFPEGERHRE